MLVAKGKRRSCVMLLFAGVSSSATPTCSDGICEATDNILLQVGHTGTVVKKLADKGDAHGRQHRSDDGQEHHRPCDAKLVSDGACSMLQEDPVCNAIEMSAEKLGTCCRHGIGMDGFFLPYFSSAALEGDQALNYKKAAIFIHGLGAHANAVFCHAVKVENDQKASGDPRTLVIAPWFGKEVVPADMWNEQLPRGINSTCWSGPKWEKGGHSAAPTNDHQSAFELLDAIVSRLRNRTRFPSMETIVLAGHSAGCQMLSRWAVFSSVPADSGAAVSVVVGNCGSYLYFDESRPAAACTPLRDTGVNHTCQDFEAPTHASLLGCPAWNEYKYGLDLDPDHNPYVHDILRNPKKVDAAMDRFAKTHFKIVLGSQDTCNCKQQGFTNAEHCFSDQYACERSAFDKCCDTFPDATSMNHVDTGCGANLGGSNRLQRGLNYASYLRHFFSKRNTTYIPRLHIFDGGHDIEAWMRSEAFVELAR